MSGYTFQQYTPPAPPEFEDSDVFKPSEHLGKPLIVKVIEHKHIEKTKHKPDGGPGVVCHVLDLSNGTKYRRVLWMGGAVVDGFKQYLGGNPVVVRFAVKQPRKTGGNEYVAADPGTPADYALAQQYVSAMGDPFPVALDLPTAPPQQQAGPAWGAPQDAPAWAQPAAPVQQQTQQAPPWQQQAPAAAPPVATPAQVGPPTGWAQQQAAVDPAAAALAQQQQAYAQQQTAQALLAAAMQPQQAQAAPPWQQQAPAAPAQPATAAAPPWQQQAAHAAAPAAAPPPPWAQR